MMMRALSFLLFGETNVMAFIERSVSTQKHMRDQTRILILRLKTNLQREGEFTPLLIDPAALMDKRSIDDKKPTEHTHTTQDPSYCNSPAAFQ